MERGSSFSRESGTGLNEPVRVRIRKSSAAAGTFMPGYSRLHSGSNCSSGPGSSTAPDSEWAPTAEAFSRTHTLAVGLSCFRRIAHARPAGPAPTMTTSYCMTSRWIALAALLASVTACPLAPLPRKCVRRLFRLHADRAIQADRRAIQHRDLQHAGHELCKLPPPAEPRRA